mmetsp:Transcript_23462/g.52735  ORF Transcript_23462/g.52735 Transcript_23462/m.52735 type:complete len:163 (+) Transcript_23462:1617-2105(+)
MCAASFAELDFLRVPLRSVSLSPRGHRVTRSRTQPPRPHLLCCLTACQTQTPDLESLKLLLTSLIESFLSACLCTFFATLRISVKSSSFLPFVREIVSSLLKCMINLGNSLTVQYKSPNFFISALFTMSICISISSAKCRNNPLLNPASCAFALEYAETTSS